MSSIKYDDLIVKGINGDKQAIELLIANIQGLVYNIAVRYLWNPADAEDATQEILIKIVTNITTFKGESKFTTWVYKIASNYLLNMKRTEIEDLTFKDGDYHLSIGATYPAYENADKDLLEKEVKIACSTSMLICVTRPLRLAYLIGEILEFNSIEGSYILEIEPDTFRKRLSLARQKIRAFMAKKCGIYNPKNNCRCTKQINYCIEVDWFKPNKLNFADKGKIDKAKEEIETIMSDTAIFQSHPTYTTPQKILDEVKMLLYSNKIAVLTQK